MIRVGVVGASGYTALELLKRLVRHPQVAITSLTSRDPECPPLAEVHPQLRDRLDLSLEPLELDAFADQVDVAFTCLPHAASAEVVAELLQRRIRVVDFSADYRLNDVATFEQWYGVTHPDPQRVGHVPYGVPEFFRESIRQAELVANPGCFPSSALLPLVPLVQNGLVQPDSIIVDSKTGVSGAGRKPHLKFHFPECNESMVAYGGGQHRHMPEIDQILKRITGVDTEVIFNPHLAPMDRGILSTIYVRPAAGIQPADVLACWRQAYAGEPFVRIADQPPATRDVSHTNYCDLFAYRCRNQLVLTSALDNLIKGASGAAIQNFNVMCGLPETTALD